MSEKGRRLPKSSKSLASSATSEGSNVHESIPDQETTATSIIKPVQILEAIKQHRLYLMLNRLAPHDEINGNEEENPIVLGDRVGKGKQCQILELRAPKIVSGQNERSAVAKIYPFYPTMKIDSKSPYRTLTDIAKSRGFSLSKMVRINDHIRDPKKIIEEGTKIFLPRSEKEKKEAAEGNIAKYDTQEGRIKCIQVFLSEAILLSYVRSLLKRKLSPHFVAAHGFYGAFHAGYILLERVDGSMDNLATQILRDGHTRALRSLLFQVAHGILVMQAYYKVMHYDTNLGNIFATNVDNAGNWNENQPFTNPTWIYGLNDTKYAVDHTGWLFKLGDFGFAAKFVYPQIVRDDVYNKMFEDKHNIIPEYQVGYDLMYTLACVYFCIYYRWQPENSAERKRRDSVCTDFERLIYEMSTTYYDDLSRQCIDRWKGWKSGKKEDDTVFAERSIVKDDWNEGDEQHCYAITKCFFDHFYEHMVLRPKKEYSRRISPSHFLELGYFDCYREAALTQEPGKITEVSTIMFNADAHFDKFIVPPAIKKSQSAKLQ
uniref:Serine/threonine protein kinase n=1 Tax=Clandestinovirus TaxID=2831644 RepID=A0A8F8PR94_9VIRU|nr:serine/threonine protein kinase [Clandestinovirus]